MITDVEIIRLINLFLRSPFYKAVPVAPSGISPSTTFQNPAPEMICGSPDVNGFAHWRPVDSPIDEEIVAGFERFLDVKLPPAFKSYLTYKCLFNNDLHFSMLPDLDPRHPLGWLEWCVNESRRPELRSRHWYVPFTLGRAGMGVLCFDSRYPDECGDYPIILAIDENPNPLEKSTLYFNYIEMHKSFKDYIIFICDSLEYINGEHFMSQPLESWLSEQCRVIPAELRYYRP